MPAALRALFWPTRPWETGLASSASSRPRPRMCEWAPMRSMRVMSLTCDGAESGRHGQHGGERARARIRREKPPLCAQSGNKRCEVPPPPARGSRPGRPAASDGGVRAEQGRCAPPASSRWTFLRQPSRLLVRALGLVRRSRGQRRLGVALRQAGASRAGNLFQRPPPRKNIQSRRTVAFFGLRRDAKTDPVSPLLASPLLLQPTS